MPTVNGNMYPELNIHPIENPELSILLLDVDDALLPDFLEKLNVLRTYIDDKYDNQYSFRLHINSESYSKQIQQKYGFTVAQLNKQKSAVLDFASANNIDVIYSSDTKFVLELYQGQHPYELLDKFSEVKLEIEAFLTGKDIAWSFDDAVWNATWLSKYNQSDAIMQNVMKLLNKYQTQGGSREQIDYSRALTNKAGHIRHNEEALISLVQKKNYSERNNSIKNSYGYTDSYDYSFEITYHLGNYYFLMSGVIDIIGRLLNKTYGLGSEQNIERAKFNEKLAKSNKELVSLFTEKVMNDWIIWLKKRRNYVAHEANTTYSDVLKSKAKKTPQAEIDKIVNGLKDWGALAALVGAEHVENMKQDAKFVIRIYEDSTILTRDAMSIPWFNYEEKSWDTRLFHPLINIRADYDKIYELLKSTVNILTR